ncbi:MAG: type I-E CRISPR-associated protein Cse1/CasA [Armatimonadota bacterium]|nr:type I-E CRISPR-associated protein Cse1/CasA [Armatimonadota bacterium]MDR7611444.1 type I-E CRISPR-associated protein Cse1/CasA [Armatimonadota bacterium]
MPAFNLLEAPWIPVLRDGRVQEVGVAEALVQAHTIHRIEAPSPLEEMALHRLLLAVLHRALRGPANEGEALDLLNAGKFDRSTVEDYLARFRDRFYLFHGTAPFWQVADLPGKDPLPWSKLLPDLASGNNPTLFDHTVADRVPKVSYAEAARALLVHQNYAPGGLIRRLGVTSAKDAPLARPAAFLAVGRNLFETLVLNLVPQSTSAGAAIWEVPPLTTAKVRGHATKWPLQGVARVYTWPSRGVRLLDAGDGVRETAYGPGVEPVDVVWRDPMVAYRRSQLGQVVPLRLDVERSFWRDFRAMLPVAGGSWPAVLQHASRLAAEVKTDFGVRVLGQVSDQAKVMDIRREVYRLPRDLLSPKGEVQLQKALELGEEVGRRLEKVAWGVAQGVLGDKNPDELRFFGKSLPLLRLYWEQLDHAFLRFLEALGGGGALEEWREEVRKAASRSWRETIHFVGVRGRHLKALAVGERALAEVLRC